MEDFKIDAAVVTTIHSGMRLGDGFAWEDNARRKAAGEKRVLRRFPTDPRVTWDEWKQDTADF